MPDGLRAAVLSLEPWDEVWRRNQHFAAQLVHSGAVSSLLWVSPPTRGLSLRASSSQPLPGIEVVEPPLVVPRRRGGHRLIGGWLRRRLAGVDVIWVNDPISGAAVLSLGIPAVYDVTDDWRSMPQSAAMRERIVGAENQLAAHAETVVCSSVLAARWKSRYGVDAEVIPNAVDVDALRSASRRKPPGRGPHAVYVGTAHASRLDVGLVAELARSWPGTVHIIGPNGLVPNESERLVNAGVQLPGAVPAAEVAPWLVSADVLICPHLVDDFTLSLDAIKAHEYLATDRPVVATPSCGFQSLNGEGVAVVARGDFTAAVLAAADTGPFVRPAPVAWADRAAVFAAVLVGTTADRDRR